MRLNNKTFLTIVISGILLMTSCVNDDDLPFLNDSTVSWESTLSDILEDNSQMLLSNKLELLDFSAIPYNFESEESVQYPTKPVFSGIAGNVTYISP